MWEPLAVVMTLEMLQLDGLDGYWVHYGAHRWMILLVMILLSV